LFLCLLCDEILSSQLVPPPSSYVCMKTPVLGSGWALVRHTMSTWHPTVDSALGTSSYGIYGNINSTEPFSVGYSSISFTEILFATGDLTKWAILNFNQLTTVSANPYPITLSRSHLSPNSPTIVTILNRGVYPQDPLLTVEDINTAGFTATTDSESLSLLYAENSLDGYNYWRENHMGANVWVRNFQLCPDTSLQCWTDVTHGGGWALVRHVGSGSTWHPVSDRATGTAPPYGTYGTQLSQNPFSLRFSDFPYSEMIFATGDWKRWIQVDASQIATVSNTPISVSLTSSDLFTTPYSVQALNRVNASGDPWLSDTDYGASGTTAITDTDAVSMLYGEDAFDGWDSWLLSHRGANVWIRNFDLCPLPDGWNAILAAYTATTTSSSLIEKSTRKRKRKF